MEAREQRGLELAATKQIRRKGQCWMVPSQENSGNYIVDLKSDPPANDFPVAGQRITRPEDGCHAEQGS